MIQITVEGRRASVSNKELLTSGSAGIEAQFTLDEAWELAPARTAVFRVGDDGSKYDVPLDNSLTCVVPPECLTVSDEVLFIGIYGGNGSGTIIIPTIWVSAGVIRPGTEPNTPREYQPTPSVVEQIHIIANRAEQTATDAMTLVEEGLSDLSALESTVQANEEQRQDNEDQRIADFNAMMQSARAYVLEPSVSAIVYDPNAESGEKISPAYLSINAYYIDNEGNRGGFVAPNFEVSIIPESGTPTTTSWTNTTGVSLELPQTITSGTTVQARIWKDNSLGLPMTLAEITIPVISDGLNGYSGVDGIVYTLEPSVNAIVYDPNAALGERISPTSLTVNMYEKRGTASRIAKLVSRLTIEINGIAYFDTGVSSFTKELGNLTPNSTVRAFASDDGKRLTMITIPIVSHGKQGLQGDPGVSPEVTVTPISGGHTVEIEDADGVKTFDVMDGVGNVTSVAGKTGAVTLDGNDVSFDQEDDYDDGTVGKALKDELNAIGELNRQISDVEENQIPELKNAIDQKQNAPSSAGTAGQVLGLDSNLDPVWVNQSGGGGDTSNCAPIIINTASGDVASFADGADNRQIRKIVGTIVPVQSGTGDPSPDNVRPISGWTGANIEQRGKNLLNNATPYKPITAASTSKITSQADMEAGLAAGQMLFYGLTMLQNTLAFNSNNRVYAVFKDMPLGTYAAIYNKGVYGVFDDLSTETIQLTGTSETPNGISFTIDKKYKYVIVYCHNYAQSSTQNPWTIDEVVANMMVAVGDKVGSYASYHGQKLPINWQTEAGTVYGGTVTLNEDGSADVVADYALGAFDGTESWGSYGAAGFSINLGSIMQTCNASEGFCNMYPVVTSGSPTTAHIRIGSNNTVIYVRSIIGNVSGVTDLTTWKAFLANNNLQVTYPLATPQTCHFANIGQLKTFLGTNNVWIDTGAITECDYPADTKIYVDESGGGGTSDYTQLTNKPQINGVTLTGNKSLSDIGAIALPANPTSGQFLKWNGSAWVADDLPVYNGGVT